MGACAVFWKSGKLSTCEVCCLAKSAVEAGGGGGGYVARNFVQVDVAGGGVCGDAYQRVGVGRELVGVCTLRIFLYIGEWGR